VLSPRTHQYENDIVMVKQYDVRHRNKRSESEQSLERNSILIAKPNPKNIAPENHAPAKEKNEQNEIMKTINKDFGHAAISIESATHPQHTLYNGTHGQGV
jgi:hypothetical protein